MAAGHRVAAGHVGTRRQRNLLCRPVHSQPQPRAPALLILFPIFIPALLAMVRATTTFLLATATHSSGSSCCWLRHHLHHCKFAVVRHHISRGISRLLNDLTFITGSVTIRLDQEFQRRGYSLALGNGQEPSYSSENSKHVAEEACHSALGHQPFGSGSSRR